MGTNKDTMNNKHLRTFTALWFLLEWGLASCGGHIEFGTPVIHLAPCPIDNLLLNEIDFPGNDWEETGSRSEKSAPVRMGIEKIGTSFSNNTEGAIEDVYRFESERQAKSAYMEEVESWFTPTNYQSEWTIPQELDNLAINAAQYRVGCNDLKSGGRLQCQYVSRYGPYIIRFLGGMRALTHEDFIGLINGIDQRATSCLGFSQPTQPSSQSPNLQMFRRNPCVLISLPLNIKK